jgi:PAS domain S-box-containing protein
VQSAVPPDRSVSASFQQLAAAIALLASVTGLAVLVGWALDLAALKSLLPTLPTMKPLTALGFLLAGIALWLLRHEGPSPRARRLALLCITILSLIGGLTLLEYLAGVDLGIDQLLFAEAVRAEPELYPGRPSPSTSLVLLLLGLALAALDRNATALVPPPALAVLLIGLLAVAGYIYGSSSLYRLGVYASMALHTALLCILLALGSLCARPTSQMMAVVTASLAGSVAARLLLPASVVLPFLLGWLRLQGELLGWYDTRLGLALFATSNAVVFGGLVYLSAAMLNRMDATRAAEQAALQASEESIRQLNAELEQRVELRTAELRAALAKSQALYRLSQTLNSTSELPELLQALADQISFALPADRVTLILLDLEARQVRQYIQGGAELGNPPTIPFDELLDGLTGWVLRERLPALSLKGAPDIRETPEVRQRRAETGCGSIIVAPLFRQGAIIGTLTAINRPEQRDFTTADVELLAGMAHQVAIGVENTQLVESLRDSEAKLRALFEVLPVGVWIMDGQRRILDSNPALERIIHVSKERLEQDSYAFRHCVRPDGTPMDMEELASSRALREQRAVHNVETGILTETGETIWTSVSASPLPLSDQGVVVAATDITELKRAEAQIRAALREKEVLLKEIHHRVKNNLQVISSLLRLQSDGVSDPCVRELFLENQRRVRSMALIHEQLYRTDDLSDISFSAYVTSLVSFLRRSFTHGMAQLRVRVEVEEAQLEIERAMPLGLIINELVSNSLKHAFPTLPPGQPGEIWVRANGAPGGGLTLEVGDTGVGLPDEIDLERSTSMGLQLVHSLVTQLRGHLTVQRRPGTRFTIVIPEGQKSNG